MDTYTYIEVKVRQLPDASHEDKESEPREPRLNFPLWFWALESEARAALLSLACGRRIHVLEKASLFGHCLEFVIATNEANLTDRTMEDANHKHRRSVFCRRTGDEPQHMAPWLPAAGLPGFCPSPAEARYPRSPVKIVVPYAAGGGADLLARILAQELSLRTQGQFIVENRTGGGTVVGTRAVIGAKPDGYTLLMTQTSLPISAAVIPSLGYDVRRDLTPIVNIALGPNGLFVHPSVPAKTFNEFLAYARSNPGKLSYSSGGVATVSHLVGESLKALRRHRSRARASARNGSRAH